MKLPEAWTVMQPSAFDRSAAWHLLRRLQWGCTPAEIQDAVDAGLSAVVDRFLTLQPEREDFERQQQMLWQHALSSSRLDALQAWWMYRLCYSSNPLQEKLTLMWHNHFATSFEKVQRVDLMAQQNELLRRYAWAHFSDLLREIAQDPAMLIWLDGALNRRRHPNENFAREVMELFTLGVGNYTEQDIQEAARAFTGWQIRERRFWFNQMQHDPGSKTVFGQTGPWNGYDILRLCEQHPAHAVFMAQRLCKTFVSDQPSASMVHLTALAWQRHQGHLAEVLRELFTSAEFFAPEHRHALITSPVEFVLSVWRPLGASLPLAEAVRWLAALGQELFMPPNVKGWPGGWAWVQTSQWITRWNLISHWLYGSQPLPLENSWLSTLSSEELLAVWLGEERPDVLQALKTLTASAESGRANVRQQLHLLWSLPEFQRM
ncbi:MAG: hypothetical protein KatS3mg113_0620 [Planctomycetaceae bacterium]|nr:MAG: hypothetical protein KatS3mg113_0620 [Planctomycetaceae bacterium]